MNNIVSRIIVFIGLISASLACCDLNTVILPALIIISLSGFYEYYDSKKLSLICFLIYVVISIKVPQMILFLPLAFYDLVLSKYKYYCLFALIPLIFNLGLFSPGIVLLFAFITAIEIVLINFSRKSKELKEKYINQRDEFTELSINLEKKLKQVINSQDAEINLATLNERNRIAREIHDNVGHLLSSSIIQIGAIMAITNEEATKNMLNNVKTTLDSGMNSIRSSIHDLHDDSFDLYSQLNKLVDEFTFCKARLVFDIETELSGSIKYTIIAIVKESLVNVIKHSNASEVKISCYEHPKIIQLIIHDNGTKKNIKKENGIGLENISQRVANLDGYVNFDRSDGFKIFVSFPKK